MESHSGGGATCARAGMCDICYKYYYTNHNWGAWTKADENQHVSTCQNSGCNQTQSGEHTGGNASCSTEGTCTICLNPYKNSNKHVGPYTYSYESSASSANQHRVTETCTSCGKASRIYDEDHQLEPHDGKAPTCMESGWEAYQTCKYCTYSTYSEINSNPTAHNLVQHDAKAPTCTAIGWDAYQTCTRCDYTTYVEKSKLEHKYVYHSGRAPTCTTIGWSPYYTCARCDYTTYSPKGMLGHDPVNHAAQAPTCTEIGWDAYQTCSRCNYSTYVEKKALGHDPVNHAAKASTCTEIGWDAYQTCSRCDYSTYAEKSALGHALVNHVAKAPTCTAIGWNAYDTCSRCDYSTYVEKSALGHALVNHAAKTPTCTAIGWDAYQTCSRCDYSTYVEKSALGHALVNHAAKAPTCTEIGWDAYQTCSRCDYSTYAELPALGHDYAARTTRPSCTERGYTTHACTRCADSYRDAYVAVLGHRYGEWIPNADGTNASACLRDCGDVRTADCATLGYALPAGDGRMELTLCPVCGEVSEIRLLDAEGKRVETLDGAVLLLIEDATAEAVNKRQPAGEAIVRMGALESGDTLLSVAFESDGELTRPSGQVNISLPAELLDGHTLALIGEDGTETPIDFEVEEDTASFTLDFTDSLTPARLIRLVPEA